MKVNVEICERRAIYVDNSRITDRSTKWGLRATLDHFECEENQVVLECMSRGFVDHVKAIDTEPYLSYKNGL